MVEQIIKQDWFLAFKEETKKDFSLSTKEKLEVLYTTILSEVSDWRYTTGSYYNFLPFSLEINKTKRGQLLKAIPKSSRFISYGFSSKGDLLIEQWAIQGDKQKFGTYVNCKSSTDSNSDIVFFSKHNELNRASVTAITRQTKTNNNIIVYLSLNGIKEKNWSLRVDEIDVSGQVKRICRYDPVFDITEYYEVEYIEGSPNAISANGNLIWTALKE